MNEGGSVVAFLIDLVIVISGCSYLRQVGDAYYLMALRYFPELFCYDEMPLSISSKIRVGMES